MQIVTENPLIAIELANKLTQLRRTNKTIILYSIEYDEEQLKNVESDLVKTIVLAHRDQIEYIVPETSMEDENYIKEPDLECKILK